MFDLYCSYCKKLSNSVTEDFTSSCCYEPFMTKEGAHINAEMVMEWLDQEDAYYAEEGLKK